ncbi:MAG: primosomal protein N' [Rhodospirillaceae bacterium]|nr:primosomal protein N' [Rhodospirillaceae bacterium]MBT5299037.1 primosomal protein N' [Rhodospirillaceae bacterium]MBT5514898.1 primosomal protein N' [Rhodospirillaceae bacterium]MBT6085067.1 primosomal protein N' [Rhodospirillaceae bacterium]MBT7510388.1 primosomal protein N' [Rhodospirillaceae bacterium]
MSADTAETFTAGTQVSILLPLPLGSAYDYRVPNGMRLAVGDFVRVPLGPRTASGVVWGPGKGDIDAAKVKEVIGLHDCRALPDASRRFVDWVARYTLASPGAVLKMAMSVSDALDPPKPQTAYTKGTVGGGIRMTPARQRVLACTADGPPRGLTELAREAGVSTSVIKGLADAGAVTMVSVPVFKLPPAPDPEHAGPKLSTEQAEAAETLSADAAAGGFGVTLLDGVPGAGKTEVYFQAVAETLKKGQQVLVLLPEIALSAQWLERFRRRFGALPAEWHSDLTHAQRRATWRAVSEGRTPVIVGARSALFLPFADLGLIIVDEEHESAFKQEEGVIYNGRDMAVVRAQLGDLPITLVSATPSLETIVNAESGRYTSLHLPLRHAGAALPEIGVVDMLKTPPPRGDWISPPLRDAVEKTLANGEQALLFLNRRGYAPLTLCRRCGHRFQCPRCTAWLVEHRLAGRLQCHHCGFNAYPPDACPSCEAEESLVACGPGVERLAEEVARSFPDARVIIAASDNIASPSAAARMVGEIERHEVDLVIGTQIVAKGYHFPLLTLVGAIDADLGLQGGDLRAAERTYQLLYQVAGRAGRGEKPGRVLLQTYMANHPVIQALSAGDRDAFLAAEQSARRDVEMPPFGRLVALIVSGKDEVAVDDGARNLARTAPKTQEVRVLGPAPAPIALLRGRHRRRLLLKAKPGVNVQSAVREWLGRARWPKKVRVQIDVDPYSFF